MRSMKKVFMICMVLVLFVCTACSAKTSTKDTDRSKIAEAFLQTVFDVSEDDVSGFLELSSEEDMQAWMSDKYGAYMTADGLNSGMQNRILSMGIELLREGKSYEEPQITIDKKENAGEEEWYDYKVTVSAGDEEIIYSGSMLLVQEEGKWKIDQIARQK